jgi:hypothetical protein
VIKKIKTKISWYLLRRENEAAFKAFIAGMQYGEYLAKKEANANIPTL